MSASSFNRPGAVDLSALAARAKQAAAPTGSRGPSGQRSAGPPGGGGSYVVEATEQTFEAEAIRKSMTHPVVVELYSPRVSTGQQLSDALIDVANSSDGKFLLVRLDVDTAPSIVQALQLQAVPTVIALIGGQLAPLFQGVLGRAEVQQAIDSVIKAAVAYGSGRAGPNRSVDGPPSAEQRTTSTTQSRRGSSLRRGRRRSRARRLRRGRRGVRQAAAGQPERCRGQGGQGAGGPVGADGEPRSECGRRRRQRVRRFDRRPARRRRCRGRPRHSGGCLRPPDRGRQEHGWRRSRHRPARDCSSCSRSSVPTTRGCSRPGGTLMAALF